MISLVLISSATVYLSRNPIYSLMFLILTFIFCSFFLFTCFAIPAFIPLAFLLIYVGAIAILFLFVLMLVNLRLDPKRENSIFIMAINLLIIVLALVYITYFENFTYSFFLPTLDKVFDLTMFGSMFEPHLFFLVGLVLAGPLFTVIGIVKQDYVPLVKIQNSVTQISRSLRTVGVTK